MKLFAVRSKALAALFSFVALGLVTGCGGAAPEGRAVSNVSSVYPAENRALDRVDHGPTRR